MNASRRLWRSGTTSIAPHVIVAGPSSSEQAEARAKQGHQCIAISRGGSRIEQRIGVGHAEIVGGVEIVDDERARYSTCVEMEIQVAERRRMSGRNGRH